MPRRLYSLALWILLPFAVSWFVLRGWRQPAYRGRLSEVLALRQATRGDQPLWLHAASVGEVQALAGLVRALTQMQPPVPLVLTAGTPTGLARARDLYGELLQPQGRAAPRLSLQLAPWDLPGAAMRFLRANRPRTAVFIETELWPNLIAACTQQAVPLLLVSARVSPRSQRRYQRFAPRMMQQSLRAMAAISAQTEADRQRFIALGAEAARVSVEGNLKFDMPLPADIVAQGERLRAGIAARPLWVAGSTHAAEEVACLDAQRQLLAAARDSLQPLPLLVLAPRRPERFAAVANWLDEQQVRFARLSMPDARHAGCEVLLLDAMGGLLPWYAAADAAFVGGSLVPVGGHNLLEPAALGKPVIAGPHCSSAPAAAALLAEAHALLVVNDAAELALAVGKLLSDASLARATGARGAAVVAANRGATARALALIATHAPDAGITAPARAPESMPKV
jgi:3-deoxy-D-manno-octulosonic-acid transferase